MSHKNNKEANMSSFHGITYKGWELDFEEMIRDDPLDDIPEVRQSKVEDCIARMKRAQRLFEGDRSHPQIVALDLIIPTLTYPSSKWDVRRAERHHIVFGPPKPDLLKYDCFPSFLARMKKKQAEYELKKNTADYDASEDRRWREIDFSKLKIQWNPPPHTTPKPKKTSISQSEVNEQEDEDSVCVICMEHKRSHAFAPCGHLIICARCAWEPGLWCRPELRCPYCREQFTKVVKMD